MLLNFYQNLIKACLPFAEFMDIHPEYLAKNNALSFVSDNEGERYNLCHCASAPATLDRILITHKMLHTVWSNFEIADMDFWRGEAYSAYFDYLESKGGFYYEVRISSFSYRPLAPLT